MIALSGKEDEKRDRYQRRREEEKGEGRGERWKGEMCTSQNICELIP